LQANQVLYYRRLRFYLAQPLSYRIDAAHAGIKKDLDYIKIQLPTTGGIDAAAVAAIKARVTGIADKLESLDAETDSDVVVPEEPEA